MGRATLRYDISKYNANKVHRYKFFDFTFKWISLGDGYGCVSLSLCH